MPEPILTTAFLAGILGEALLGFPLEEHVVKPGLEKAGKAFKKWRGDRYPDAPLREAFEAAIAAAGAPPLDEEEKVARWLMHKGLDRLAGRNNHALRRQMARAIVGFTPDQEAAPEDIRAALRWPKSEKEQLAAFLRTLRAELVKTADWSQPILYANQLALVGVLQDALGKLHQVDNMMTTLAENIDLLVHLLTYDREIDRKRAEEIERAYREAWKKSLRLHSFEGLPFPKNLGKLKLEHLYFEQGLLDAPDKEKHLDLRQKHLHLSDQERLELDERRLADTRIQDGLARHDRLVILGDPGSGKTISLNFITLMLAHGFLDEGGSGTGRLGLSAPYIPIKIRISEYARVIDKQSLTQFLVAEMERWICPDPNLPGFLHWALDQGLCFVLLDGLDELSGVPAEKGHRSVRAKVVQSVKTFADLYVPKGNRLVVTSRIEGYWDEPLEDFAHVELSPLRPPDEIIRFTEKWHIASALKDDPELNIEEAQHIAEHEASKLWDEIVKNASVRRLAMNPLLLTILILLREQVIHLPQKRVRVYDKAAEILLHQWQELRQQADHPLLDEFEIPSDIRKIFSGLAYWLHETAPGGTATAEEIKQELTRILADDNPTSHPPQDVTEVFWEYSRNKAGLIVERGMEQYGFFHLTFEEYFAAVKLVNLFVESKPEYDRALQVRWNDPRWREVILLAGGELNVIDERSSSKMNATTFVNDVRTIEEDDDEIGRPAILAGRVLLDIGEKAVRPQTARDVQEDLWRYARSELRFPRNAEEGPPPAVPLRTRYEAGELYDEFWLPDDLNSWRRCPGCAAGGGDLLAMTYPVTNVQFEVFIDSGGYDNPDFWGGEASPGWRWRMDKYTNFRGTGLVSEPWYWRDSRFGRLRRAYPVVGVSWYEAAAYGGWLAQLLRTARQAGQGQLSPAYDLIRDLLAHDVETVKLPASDEWTALAGGLDPENRFPWDGEGEETAPEAAAGRANVDGKLGGTSPVWLFPENLSHPHRLAELAGNVWEWCDSWEDEEQTRRVLRGGSWGVIPGDARAAVRDGLNPDYSANIDGFRCVAPIGSGS